MPLKDTGKDIYKSYVFIPEGRRPRILKPGHVPKVKKQDVAQTLVERDSPGQSGLSFTPSVHCTSEELAWITEHLTEFYDNHLITDVAWRVKGGKEANVYGCPGHPKSILPLYAAKVYRPRQFRSLNNTSLYDQGRDLLSASGTVNARDWRMAKSIKGKGNAGLTVSHTSWLTHEYMYLDKLRAAGADVPRPVAHNACAILMQYIGDAGMAAPALVDVKMETKEAKKLFKDVLKNIEIILSLGWAHGDLSAYNIPLWQGKITLIDFPQLVDVRNNPSGRMIFDRDVDRVCQYFERFGVKNNPIKLAAELWKKHIAGK